MAHVGKHVVHQEALQQPFPLLVEKEEHLRRGGESEEGAVLRERRRVLKRRGRCFYDC